MLLPVWSVDRSKWEYSRGERNIKYSIFTKESLQNLQQFTHAKVIGHGVAYEVLNYVSPYGRWMNTYTYYDYIVKVADIENYTKQKFKE
jgi:hypothetical protein